MILLVTLDQASSLLDVSDTGNANQVGRNPNPQNITWQLSGNAATGDFVAMDLAEPGFVWTGTQPPAGIFGTPQVSGNGNQISFSDLNNSASTAGTFYYQLRATIGGVVYATAVTPGLMATTTNPRIINN